MPVRTLRRPAPLTDAEAETLRLQLLEIIPRLQRHQLLDLADTLHDAARERRGVEPRHFDLTVRL